MKPIEPILWRSGANWVTHHFIHMRRRTVAMADIDLVELHRPFIALTLSLALALTLLGVRFHEVMTETELSLLIVPGWIAVVLSFQVAELKLHSYSLKDLKILMPIWRAKPMREAIDQVIDARKVERDGHAKSAARPDSGGAE